MMAAGRPRAGRDYAWRGARCSILRSGDIAVRTTPAAGRCVRAVVTSDGIGGTDSFGGTDGFGGTVPLWALVTSDGIGGTGGIGGAVPLGDGRGRVVAGPGSGRGAAGSGIVFPWQVGSAAASPAAAWLAAGRNAAAEDGRASGC
jgi:hypothetical protein